MKITNKNLKKLLLANLRELSTVEGNILGSAKGREIKSIMVTSPTALEGKTITAISLAYGLATENQAKVLLVDGNLRYPNIHKLLNVKAEPGLSDLFVSNAEYAETIMKTEDENLMVMPHGAKMYNSLDVYRSPMFKEKLDELKQKFDYVIFDCFSVQGSSDVSIAAKHFDGIILAVKCEKTRYESLQESIDKINQAGGHVLGTVLTKRRYYIPRMLYGKV